MTDKEGSVADNLGELPSVEEEKQFEIRRPGTQGSYPFSSKRGIDQIKGMYKDLQKNKNPGRNHVHSQSGPR